MRVRIDSELCQGHQMCAIVAPKLFGSDDEGFGRVLGDGVLGDGVLNGGEVAPELASDARRAAESCPEQAVIVEPHR